MFEQLIFPFYEKVPEKGEQVYYKSSYLGKVESARLIHYGIIPELEYHMFEVIIGDYTSTHFMKRVYVRPEEYSEQNKAWYAK